MAEVPVVFVNSVAVSGFLNGVINVAFNTAQFLPEWNSDQTGKYELTGKVAVSEVITANLRLDLHCAQQLHDLLASIIAQQTKPAAKDIQ